MAVAVHGRIDGPCGTGFCGSCARVLRGQMFQTAAEPPSRAADSTQGVAGFRSDTGRGRVIWDAVRNECPG